VHLAPSRTGKERDKKKSKSDTEIVMQPHSGSSGRSSKKIRATTAYHQSVNLGIGTAEWKSIYLFKKRQRAAEGRGGKESLRVITRDGRGTNQTKPRRMIHQKGP